MSGQLNLFRDPIIQPSFKAESSYDERFEVFDSLNPHVYKELEFLALQAKRKGYRRIGIKMLFEVLRWNRMMQTKDPSGDFKLNNNYHSRYARALMERNWALADMFELRELKT